MGKSTLFNRLIGQRKAVISTIGGTTRDRLYGPVEWRGIPLTLIDIGGLEFARTIGIAAEVQKHAQRALQEADGFLFLCDAQDGFVPADAMIMERLRKTGKPIVVAVNKADQHLVVPPEFFSLGVAEVSPVSALHGRGTGELLDVLVERVAGPPAPQGVRPAPVETSSPPSQRIAAIAIVGRQNVGKSSLFNALLREERVIVSEVPGTTRDAVDTALTVQGTPVVLIDTAGLRHRRKVREPVDHFAMSRAISAIERCDVALVVLDATQGVTRDDQRIVTRVCEAGCGCVLVLNKWDLVSGGGRRVASRGDATPQAERRLAELVHRAAPSARFAPVLAVSAKTGFHVARSLTMALQVVRSMRRVVSESECRAILEQAWAAQPPPRYRGRPIRLRQVRWVPGRPVRLELDTAPVSWLPGPYQHYLLKRLYASPRFSGIPILLIFKKPGRTS